MKKLFIFLCWLIALFHSQAETKSEAFMASKLTRVRNMSDQEKIKYLMDFVVFESNYNVPRSQRELDLIQEAIIEVVKTPGHAELYAEEVRRKQKEVAHLPFNIYGTRNDYNMLRMRYLFKTLPLMPSPETIKVLGEFLSDAKDLPDGPIPGDYYANNGYAVMALKKIGLRNPAEKYPLDASNITIKMWQAWYEKVKAGEITFSFEGQPHEYRFNPDGTWITIPLEKSEDTPEPEKETATPVTSSQGHPPAKHPPSRKSPWLFVGGFLSLGVLSLLIRSFMKRRAGEKLA